MRSEEHRKLLISIKKGELGYDEIMEMANRIIEGVYEEDSLENRFKNSDLPEEVSLEYIQESLMKVRKTFYKI